MKDIMQQLANDPSVGSQFRRILAGEKPVFPLPHRIEQLETGIEGALKVLDGMTAPNALAAVSILKGALQQ